MNKEQQIKKIKKKFDDIIGVKSQITKKRTTRKDRNKRLFCEMLFTLQYLNSRSLGLKHDYKLDLCNFEDSFYKVIENLLELKYNSNQRDIINWWLYDKFLPTGEVLILTHKDTEEIIPSDTPEDVWDLIQEQKNAKKNNK